jgi:hypothetical protein
MYAIRPLAPDLLHPDILWLVSKAAGEVIGSRFVANLSDAALPLDLPAAKSRMTAGWISQTS